MEYTYFNNIDDTVFKLLRLHENPYIRNNYMKKIFKIDIRNLPNLKKGDVIQIVRDVPETTTSSEGNSYTRLAYKEKYRLDVVKINRRGEIFVKYHTQYNDTFLYIVKLFFRRLKNRIIDKFSYSFTEQECYDYVKEEKATEEIERLLGLK